MPWQVGILCAATAVTDFVLERGCTIADGFGFGWVQLVVAWTGQTSCQTAVVDQNLDQFGCQRLDQMKQQLPNIICQELSVGACNHQSMSWLEGALVGVHTAHSNCCRRM